MLALQIAQGRVGQVPRHKFSKSVCAIVMIAGVGRLPKWQAAELGRIRANSVPMITNRWELLGLGLGPKFKVQSSLHSPGMT